MIQQLGQWLCQPNRNRIYVVTKAKTVQSFQDTGTAGNLDGHFPRRGKHEEFVLKYFKNVFTRGIYLQHRETFEVLKF